MESGGIMESGTAEQEGLVYRVIAFEHFGHFRGHLYFLDKRKAIV